MRLLYVIPYYRPSLAFGGPVAVCAKLAEEMARRGHDVQVLTTDANGRDVRVKEPHSVIDGVKVQRLRNASQRSVAANLFMPLGARASAARLAANSDVVHVHEFFTWLNFRGTTQPARCGKPVLLSGHGSLSLSDERGRVPIKRLWMRLLGDATIRAASLVQAATPYEAEQCIKAGVPSDKIRIIPQGVAPPPRVGDGARFRALHRIDPHRPIVLFAGRLRASKGVDILIEAARSLADHPVRPLFVLAGAPENRPDLAAQQLSANILLTGVLSEATLQHAYAAASALVLPSFAEGMSMVVLDALAFGLPVLISPACNLPEVVACDAGIMVDTDVASLRAGLMRLLARRSDWPTMGEAGKRMIREKYSNERVFDHYERIYGELMHA